MVFQEDQCRARLDNAAENLALLRRLAMNLMAKEAMKHASPWIAELCSAADNGDRTQRFMREGTELDGVRLVVGEMTGKPGDVWLMHPGTLHAGAMNCGARPRMMLAETIGAAR